MLYTFRDTIFELAKADKRVVVICTDQDVGLGRMKQEMPHQYYMEGVSEANIMGMAAGLAADGCIPFIVNHASFLTRRSYEQIVLDVCLQERPVRLIGMGGGLATAHLGPTHTVIEDIASMRLLPHMTVVAPCDADEMRRLLPQTLTWPRPMYIRLARFGKPIVSREADGFEIGKAIPLRASDATGGNILLVSTGAMTSRALAAAENLEKTGLPCAVLHVHTVKPLDEKTLIAHARKARLLVTIEDHTTAGGLGSACLEVLAGTGALKKSPRILRLGVPDQFIHHYGTQESLFKEFGLESEPIADKVRTMLGNSRAAGQRGPRAPLQVV